MSAHKISRDSKFIVAFDESHCYVLPQGLREMKCSGDCDVNQGLNHVNFFNEIHIGDPDVPYDDSNDNASSQCDGSNHPHHNSLTIGHNENDLGHLHGSNRSTSEDEMAATSEEQLSNSMSINNNILSPVGAEQVYQPLRRSERVSTLPRKYNEFVMVSKFKFCLENFVNYSKLSFENRGFATELNKNHKPKTFWEASSIHHWVNAMNKEIDALYENNTWKISELPSDRKAIGSKWVFKIKYKSDGEIE
nr:ribonuclease H-like domain-containing protein [Tanacetum cinerariifolium]